VHFVELAVSGRVEGQHLDLASDVGRAVAVEVHVHGLGAVGHVGHRVAVDVHDGRLGPHDGVDLAVTVGVEPHHLGLRHGVDATVTVEVRLFGGDHVLHRRARGHLQREVGSGQVGRLGHGGIVGLR
jgi:hypothetical protein